MKLMPFVLLALFVAVPAQAQWTRQDYAGEYEACVPACDKNNPTDHAKCTQYCHCVMDEMQTQFPDHDRMVQQLHDRQPDRVASTQKIANACNQKFWGTPARKLQLQ